MKRQKKNKGQGRTGTEGYPVEDRALKDAARFMGAELLPLLGVEGTVKGIAPTEAVFLEVKDYLADFNYEMSDGIWTHLEFESDGLSEEDLRRFRACEAVISYKYKVEVSTYVLCTSRAKVPKSSLTQKMNPYRVGVLRMKDYNADEVIRALEEKQREGKDLERGELLEVLLISLMDGEMSQAVRIKKSLRILRREQGKLEAGEVLSMESVLYALAMKVLNEKEIREVKEMMRMTLLGQLLMEDGMELGEFKTMLELVQDGVLTMAEAAARKHMSVEEFQRKIQELNLG
ncbi:MAG: hypothetical protein HFG70_15255 [Hungatella sp.]|nr:hypothetical protein [Hungatella sp.]